MQAIGIERFVLIATCTLAAALAGCATTPAPEPEMTISKTTTSTPVQGRATFGEPEPLYGQRVLMIPYAVENAKGLFESSDPYGSPASAPASFLDMSETGTYRGAPAKRPLNADAGPVMVWPRSVRWHNVVFANPITGEQRTLLDVRGVIGSWAPLYGVARPDANVEFNGLLFIAVVDDTNKDGLLDSRDARVAILTGPDGSAPRIVSPRDAQVIGVMLDQAARRLYLLVRQDTNADGTFNSADALVPYALSLDDREPAKPLVSQATREKLDALVK